jgi:hypothetical protein
MYLFIFLAYVLRTVAGQTQPAMVPLCRSVPNCGPAQVLDNGLCYNLNATTCEPPGFTWASDVWTAAASTILNIDPVSCALGMPNGVVAAIWVEARASWSGQQYCAYYDVIPQVVESQEDVGILVYGAFSSVLEPSSSCAIELLTFQWQQPGTSLDDCLARKPPGTQQDPITTTAFQAKSGTCYWWNQAPNVVPDSCPSEFEIIGPTVLGRPANAGAGKASRKKH